MGPKNKMTLRKVDEKRYVANYKHGGNQLEIRSCLYYFKKVTIVFESNRFNRTGSYNVIVLVFILGLLFVRIYQIFNFIFNSFCIGVSSRTTSAG